MTTKEEAVKALRTALKMIIDDEPKNSIIDLFFEIDESNDIEDIPFEYINTGHSILTAKILSLSIEERTYKEIYWETKDKHDALEPKDDDSTPEKTLKIAKQLSLKRKMDMITENMDDIGQKEAVLIDHMRTVEDYIDKEMTPETGDTKED